MWVDDVHGGSGGGGVLVVGGEGTLPTNTITSLRQVRVAHDVRRVELRGWVELSTHVRDGLGAIKERLVVHTAVSTQVQVATAHDRGSETIDGCIFVEHGLVSFLDLLNAAVVTGIPAPREVAVAAVRTV